MSCGGIVVETIICPNGRVWINTKEKEYYRSECAIYVKDSPQARCVAVGDSVWWQGNQAFWTPKDKCGKPIERKDGKCNVANVVLERIGFSGVKRPAQLAGL